MRIVTMYQTADGKLHASVQAAAQHADERFGNAVIALAHRALQQDKYRAMVDFIIDNVDAFAELKALREDIALGEEE